MTNKIVVLVTCADPAEAGRIAAAVVRKRLAACVNVLASPVMSVYRWKGKVESAREFLLVMKSSRRRFDALRKEIVRRHSYEVPEVIALPIVAGAASYLAWLEESVRAEREAKRAKRRRRTS
jgi:periplasmic divalent cation tolerance protein